MEIFPFILVRKTSKHTCNILFLYLISSRVLGYNCKVIVNTTIVYLMLLCTTQYLGIQDKFTIGMRHDCMVLFRLVFAVVVMSVVR